tara:strand:- start:41123 stop:43114 length:1992 start_codon:yes stop_codon:yes gene_type:complete
MDIDKIKNFFIFHVEKMIVAVVVAASGFLVYQGLNQPNILDKIQPDKLTTDANRVRADLDENHNDAIIPERIPDFSIVERTDKTLEKVNPNLYALRNTWDVVESSGLTRREDPVLFRPKEIRVQGVITTLAMRSAADEYAVMELEPADPVEKVEQKRKPSRREQRRAMMMSDGEDESYEEEEYDMFETGGVDPSLGEAVVPVRKFSADFDDGFRPTTTKHIQNEATQYPIPALGWFIAGTAVVPHKAMHESFEHSLKDAEGYDYMNRDRPIYRGYQLQRADVTNKTVDELVDEDWVNRDSDRQVTVDAIRDWSGTAPELVPSDYRDVTLTMWVPPVLIDDYASYTLHPMIPMLPKSEIDALENVEEVDAIEEVDLDRLIFGADAKVEQAKDMTNAPMYMEVTPYGMPIADPVEYKLVRFYDFATDPRGDANAPKPGRKYVYRVRVSIDDPNFPSDFNLQPELKTLHPDAHQRVKELLATARTAKDRQYKRWTEWSDPSEPVSLPGLGQHFVGKIDAKAARPVQVGNRTVNFEPTPPTAKMVVSQFSPEVNTRIPMTIEVTEGSVLSAEADFADVIDPIKLEIRKLQYLDEEGEPIPDKKVQVVSSTTVIDINGGAKLDIDSSEGMTEPGYMLIFDPSGGLSVKPEIEEQRKYRIFSFAEERGE